MLASFLGEMLYQKTGTKYPIFITLGWTIVGVVIGASIGIFDLLRAISSGDGMRQAIRHLGYGSLPPSHPHHS